MLECLQEQLLAMRKQNLALRQVAASKGYIWGEGARCVGTRFRASNSVQIVKEGACLCWQQRFAFALGGLGTWLHNKSDSAYGGLVCGFAAFDVFGEVGNALDLSRAHVFCT